MKKIMISLVLIYLGVGCLLFIKQRDFLYYPVDSIKHTLDQEVFKNDDESITTTVLNKGNINAIIYFGGNAETVDYNAESFSAIFPKHTVFLVKYRGYGGSSGIPEEEGIYSDALYIFDKVKLKYKSVSIIGRSLGSSVATLVASKRNINKLVLITPFDSIQDMAQEQFPIYPMSLLLKDKYDSLSRVNSITAETLVIAAENDQVIGKNHTGRLVNAFPSSQITLEIIKGKGHNDISNSKKYYGLLGQFI